MIVYGTAAVSLLTLLIVFIIPKKFTASARLLPPQQNMSLSAQILEGLAGTALPGKSMGLGGGLSGMAADVFGLKSPGDLYVGMLSSNTIMNKIIGRFKYKRTLPRKIYRRCKKSLDEKDLYQIRKIWSY
jgi:hypothetical protein